MVTMTDVDDAHNWSVIVNLFDDDGNLISTTKTFDNGDTITNNIAMGSQEFIDFSADTLNFDLG